jgi:patatin-like phospholipase/acyl hydrolase
MAAADSPKTFIDKLQPTPQKKLLALDGGGIRGVVSLEVLYSIERIVRQKLGPDAVLADYFDYIAGTSTGAIIATGLSLGMSVENLRSFYINSGPAMFSRAAVLRRFHYKFDREKLAAKFREIFGADTTLGSSRLRTLLMMVMRNATTDSPWPVSNNPAAKYNDHKLAGCNLDVPLWQLISASTAAPTYFPPEEVRIGDQRFLFVDGGVTMFNNPAFQLFLMSTVQPYNLNWAAGVDRMLLVSVGTGTAPKADPHLRSQEMNLIYDVSSIPTALIYAAANQQDFLCRTFGDCLAGSAFDSEVGDMCGFSGPANPKLFTYVRYNCELTRGGLDELGLPEIVPDDVQMLDSVDHVGDLQLIGKALAEKQVKESHFARF